MIIKWYCFIAWVILILSFANYSHQTPCVAINEIYSSKQCNGTDWIELVNLCDEEINLRGYFLRPASDAKMFRLGNRRYGCDVVMAGRSYFLMERGQPCSFNFKLGREIQLVDRSLVVIDLERWESDRIQEGESYSRIPNGKGPFYPRPPTPGEFNGISLDEPPKIMTKASDVTVQISELVPHSLFPDQEPGGWIEFYNYGQEAVDLMGLRLTNRFDYPGSGFYFGLDDECDLMIEAGEYLVIGQNNSCDFGLELGLSDVVTLWFDGDTIIDTTRYGTKYGDSLLPPGVSWGKIGDQMSDKFTTMVPTPGEPNEQIVAEKELRSKIAKFLETSADAIVAATETDEVCEGQNVDDNFDNQDLDRDDGYISYIDD